MEVQACKKLDLTTLRGTDELATLRIINNGNLASLEPLLDRMPALKELQFTEGTLTDGNNLYLLRHPGLKHVWIIDRRHYLLKSNEINEALKDPVKRSSLLNSAKNL